MPTISSRPTSGNSSLSLGAAADFSQGIASFGGAIAQGSALRAQASYQAKMADINHQMAEWQASDALARGGVASNQQLIKTNEMVGSERAASAGAGVDVNSGSALRIQNRTQEMGALDALTIANNATREAFGYRVNAINATASGQFAQSAGSSAATNTMIAGGLSGLAAGLKGYDRMNGGSGYSSPVFDSSTATPSYQMPNFASDYSPQQNYSLLGGAP